MTRIKPHLIRSFLENRRGSVFALAAAIFLGLMAIGGLVLQEGLLYQADQQLQTGANMAALAGAKTVATSTSTAVAAANSYTAQNLVAGQSPTAVSGYPATKCLTSPNISCSTSGANAIVVKNQVKMNLLFGALFGEPSKTLTATATAVGAGGATQPNDVVLIIDGTYSMNNIDSSCSISGATSLQCALAGARSMLSNFKPSITNVAVMVFPPISNSAVDYCGSSGTPNNLSYKSGTSHYLVVGLSNDYKSSDTATALNGGSNLVKAVGGGGCAGVQALGGYGTYYAGVVSAAQSYLASNGRAGAKQAIVFLSDGDANASSNNVPSGMAANQCHEGITAAQNATAAGINVYTAAYGSPTALQTASCSTDTISPAVSACSTMQMMASSGTTFFPVNKNGSGTCSSTVNTNSDAATALTNIGAAINGGGSQPRLVLDNTQ